MAKKTSPKPASKALVKREQRVQRRNTLERRNLMVFPQALRDAIPGKELPDCGRALILSSITGKCVDAFFGRQIELTFRVEETGKLTGTFDLGAHLNVAAARGLAETLQKLVAEYEAGEG